MKLTAEHVARLALGTGISPGAAIIAVAIAKAESNFNTDATGDVHLQTNVWGPSLGLWQIRSLKAEYSRGSVRDQAKLYDPAFNANSMKTISRNGTYWTPWSVYKSGAYRAHLPMAEQAVWTATKVTPPVQVIRDLVYSSFTEGVDFKNLGIYNRRYIAGTQQWSQHAWGNAFDIGVVGMWLPYAPKGSGTAGQKRVDDIHNFLVQARNQGKPIGKIIWRSNQHWNHIHVEGVPPKTGIPPLLTQEQEEEMKEAITGIQKNLNKAGYKGANGQSLKEDGIWGPNTEHAHLQMCMASASSGPHTHTVTVT